MHIAHLNDKEETDIPQPFKGARPKQPKTTGGGKGKQPQQKSKPPPVQVQEDQYTYDDTNNYYHNENLEVNPEAIDLIEAKYWTIFQRSNLHGRGEHTQNPYQGQYQSNNYQGNNYQSNHGLYHRNYQKGNNYGQFIGRSHGHSRGNYHGCSHSRSNYQGKTSYQYHQHYGHDDEYQSDQYDLPCALCGSYNHSPKHFFKGEHDINDIMEKMNISGYQSEPSGLYS